MNNSKKQKAESKELYFWNRIAQITDRSIYNQKGFTNSEIKST
jgi:hypothetical protein